MPGNGQFLAYGGQGLWQIVGDDRGSTQILHCTPGLGQRVIPLVEDLLQCLLRLVRVGGQHMLRPSVAGRLLQALLPAPGEAVLEIGAGSGFVTACLRAMAEPVRSLEIFPELADAARRNLAALGMRDVEVLDADALSTDSGARYGAIAVTASLPLYDARFERMLTPGGRLFVVVGEAPIMEARLVRRTAEDAWSTESLFETVIDPLVHAVRPAGFTF